MSFKFLRRKVSTATAQKASAAGLVMAWHNARRVAWSPRDTVSLTRSDIIQNPVDFWAVKVIPEAAAALPLILQDHQQRYEPHPLLDLINRPNAAQGRAELFEALYGQFLLPSDGYIEAVSSDSLEVGSALPLELHVLGSDRMRIIPVSDGWLIGYEYQIGGCKHRFEGAGRKSSVCHIKSFHLQDDHYGLSPLQTAAQAVDVHNSASAWSKALLDNAARQSGVIIYRCSDGQGTMASDQYERLLSEMENHHQGACNAGRPMLLEGGLDWKPMGFSPSDMRLQKTKEAAAREIAMAFGMPSMLIGIPGDATYANYQEANRAFFRLTVLPLISRVVAAVSDWVSGNAGPGMLLKPDLDQLTALAPEREAQWRGYFSERSRKTQALRTSGFRHSSK